MPARAEQWIISVGFLFIAVALASWFLSDAGPMKATWILAVVGVLMSSGSSGVMIVERAITVVVMAIFLFLMWNAAEHRHTKRLEQQNPAEKLPVQAP